MTATPLDRLMDALVQLDQGLDVLNGLGKANNFTLAPDALAWLSRQLRQPLGVAVEIADKMRGGRELGDPERRVPRA